jgi:high-affinity iron transporter
MLPTFVIGLREGLEAALIVGLIAAFLRRQGRTDLVRWVLAGVGLAVLLCVAAGLALEVYSRSLPQRQQEGLETVIGVLAVGMVTYMVVWMRRHSRTLKGQLEVLAAEALHGGTATSRAGRAMVLMAFLAVIREGLETVVFLLAAFNETGSGATAGVGAVLGIAVAALLGYGIYRGGVRLNLSRFFRITGVVLVLVAAGLVVTALHTAHEAGWLTWGQSATVDLSALVRPGSVQESLLTGMLGVQSHPVVIEAVGWLVYLIPVGLYVAWPPGRAPARRTVAVIAAAGCVVAGTAALIVALAAPGNPAPRPAFATGPLSARVLDRAAGIASVELAAPGLLGLPRLGGNSVMRAAASPDVYTLVRTAPEPAMRRSAAAVAALDGGRLPLGVRVSATIPVQRRVVEIATVRLASGTNRIVSVTVSARQLGSVRDASGAAVPLARPLDTARLVTPAATVRGAMAAAASDRSQQHRHDTWLVLARWCVLVAAAALAVAVAAAALAVRQQHRHPLPATPVRDPVHVPV